MGAGQRQSGMDRRAARGRSDDPAGEASLVVQVSLADLVAPRRIAGVADPPLDLYSQLLNWFAYKFDEGRTPTCPRHAWQIVHFRHRPLLRMPRHLGGG
jgi:hypothetical protein